MNLNEMARHLLDRVDDYATTPEDLEQAEHVLAAHPDDTADRRVLVAMLTEIRGDGRLSAKVYREALRVTDQRAA